MEKFLIVSIRVTEGREKNPDRILSDLNQNIRGGRTREDLQNKNRSNKEAKRAAYSKCLHYMCKRLGSGNQKPSP